MNEPKLVKKDTITDKAIDKQKKLLIMAVICVITIFLGSSYALLTNFDKTDEVVTFTTGNLNMTVNNTDGLINLSDKLPEDETNGLKNATPITLTLTNTGTIKIEGYEVKLVSDKTQTSTLNEDYIKYAISEDGTSYSSPSILTSNSNIIYEGYGLEVDTSKTIYLKVWIDESAGNNALGKTYYGSIEVELYQKKEEPITITAADIIRENVVSYTEASASTFAGGLVAINGTEGDNYGLLYNETDATQTIREYRYSGASVNNYIYYNCPDTAGGYSYGDLDYDYQTNCEVWRIVGIFKETKEDGTEEEYLKIMKNTILAAGTMPTSYTYNETTYSIASSSTAATVYWNKKSSGTNNTDWNTAGLQYYLNIESDTNGVAGYLSTLSTTSKSLIRKTTYHLGNVLVSSSGGDTTINAYNNERSESNIHSGNESTWSGLVGLLYPSDYGYSADSSYWSGITLYEYKNAAYETSWMQQTANHSNNEWLLSPHASSSSSDYGLYWLTAGYLSNMNIYYTNRIRPVLHLKSQIEILMGDGTSVSPYVVIE